MTQQLTKDEAIDFGEAQKWEPMTLRERAEFQTEQDLLCMPFDKYHEAVEKTLGRPVWTHEFADRQHIREELAGTRPKGTVAESFEMLDKLAGNKPIIIVGDER